MANTLLTTDMITREALRIAHESCNFIGAVDRQYDDQFAKSGGKIGSALRIREANRYLRRTGSRIMDVQDTTETSQTLTVATQDGVDMRFYSDELALSIDDFSRRYIEPAVKVLVAGIEGDFIAAMTKATYNVAGAAGTAITDLDPSGAARARLNQMLAPKDGNRFMFMESVAMGKVVNGLKGLFQDSNQIKDQYREGMMGRTSGFDWYDNEKMWLMTNGSDVTGTTDASNAAVTDGGTSITYDTTASVSVNVGQVFTVAGVYACHPETKQSLGYLQQFVITALPGSRVMTVSPSTTLTGAKQNVCSSTSTQLATTDFNNKTLTFVGSASTNYIQHLAFHKEAFTFVTADLPLMSDADCSRRVQDGLSLRVWKGSDIVNDQLLMRIDCLYGWKAIRPEWACRVIGAAAA